MAVRKAITGRDALVAQSRVLELERLGRGTELQVRCAVEPRAEVLEVVLDVLERERHVAILWRRLRALGVQQLSVPLGDDFDVAVDHVDGGLIVDRVRRQASARRSDDLLPW
jgi:hypothetical protein